MKLLKAFTELSSAGKSVSLTALATASGLHSRRVTVLVNALEDLEVIERSGRSLSLAGKLGPEQLDDLFGDFDAQHQAERARLQAMIHYGESPNCRMQLLREYFGEARGHNCGHCDNCQHPIQGSAIDHHKPAPPSIGVPTSTT